MRDAYHVRPRVVQPTDARNRRERGARLGQRLRLQDSNLRPGG
jgi:hypothetical protein